MTDRQKHIERAYGLLWHVTINTNTPQGLLVSEARNALLNVLTIEERGSGIAAAKEWIRAPAMKTPQEASARMALIWALSKTNLKIPENLLIPQNWKWDDCNRHMYANTDGDKYIFYILAVAQNVSIAVLSVYDRNGKVTWEADIPEHIISQREIAEYWLNVWINTQDGSLVSELMFSSEADALENITAGYAGMTYLHTVHSLRRASGNIWDTWAIDMSDEAEAIAQDAECERRHNV